MKLISNVFLAFVLLVLSSAVGRAQGIIGGLNDDLEVESTGKVLRTRAPDRSDPEASLEGPGGGNQEKAQETVPFAFLEGNWYFTYYGAAGRTHDAGLEIKGNNVVRPMYIWPQEDSAETGVWNVGCLSGFKGCPSLKIDPEGRIYMKHEAFFLGHGGGESNLTIVGPNEVRGQWNYTDQFKGAVGWRRAPPKISRVVWERAEPVVLYSSGRENEGAQGERPARVEATYDRFGWGPVVTSRGNRPKFELAVYGENLWGRNKMRIEPAFDTEGIPFGDMEAVIGNQIKEAGHGPPSDVVGFQIYLWAWAGVRPGGKLLHVNDASVPFDLVIHGHPDNSRKAQLTAQTLVTDPKGRTAVTDWKDEELDATTPVRVRLTYEEAPIEPPTEVGVRWTEGNDFIPVSPSDDPKIFFSEWRIISRVSDLLFREVPGFPSSSMTAKNTADLFAGTWHVSQSDGDSGVSCGKAEVAANGSGVDLSLQVGDEQRVYRSFETLATRDSEGGKHTFEIRFEKVDAGGAAASEANGRRLPAPKTDPIRVLFVADDEETIAFDAGGELEQVALKPRDSLPERFRVGLRTRLAETYMSGAWQKELTTGNLGDGGLQNWTREGLSNLFDEIEQPKVISSNNEPPKSTLFITSPDGTPLTQIPLGMLFDVKFSVPNDGTTGLRKMVRTPGWDDRELDVTVKITNPRNDKESAGIELIRDPDQDPKAPVVIYTHRNASIGGKSNKTRIDYKGTINEFTHVNAGALTFTVSEPGYTINATTSLFVWDDGYELALSKMSESLTQVTNVLIAEQKVLDALRADPEVTKDPNKVADLDAWQRAIDARKYVVQEARKVYSNTNYIPIQKVRFVKYYLDKLMVKGPNGWEVASGYHDNLDPRMFSFDLNAIKRNIDDHLRDELWGEVMTGYVLGSYHVLSHVTLASPIYTLVTGENEFGQEASRGMAIVELGTVVVLIKLPGAIMEWGAGNFAWARRPGFALPSFRRVPAGRSTLPPRWGHLGKATVNEAYRGPKIADDAWVHFGDSTIRNSVAQNGVIGNGGRSYWVRWGEVKNMTQGELRWKIGESTVSGKSDLRLMVEAPPGAKIHEVPGNYGFKAEGVAEGALRGRSIYEVPRPRVSAETAGGQLPYPSARVPQGLDAGTIRYWRGRATERLAPGVDPAGVIARTNRQIAAMDAHVAVARARGVPNSVIDRVVAEARSKTRIADAIDDVGFTLEIEGAVVNGERILVAADEAALFGQYATTPRQRSTAQVFDHGVLSSVIAKATLESQGKPQAWEPFEQQVLGGILRRVQQGEAVGNWKRIEVVDASVRNPVTGNIREDFIYEGLKNAFGEGGLEAILAISPLTCR